jgi:hypothetical protein
VQNARYGLYLKMGNLPKKVTNVMNEMPKMMMAMSLRSPILLKLAACQLSSWFLYVSVSVSWTSQGIRILRARRPQ